MSFRSVLTFREKIVVIVLSGIIISTMFFWLWSVYTAITVPVAKNGGVYSEGVIGQPSTINPLLSPSNTVDADIVSLVYSGLYSYDEKGQLKKDLAESVEISEDKKKYTIHLKEGLTWHDGSILTASDIVFTIGLIQNKAAYKSPLSLNWNGVKASEIDERTVEFLLENPYFGFEQNLTVGIMPRHIWENITPEQFSLSEINLKPIGSGPYIIKDFEKDEEGNILVYNLEAFKKYHRGKPFINKFVFRYYPTIESLVDAFNNREILAVNNISYDAQKNIIERKSIIKKDLNNPSYFAVFFNQTKSVPLGYNEVRMALAHAVDRNEIVEKAVNGKGSPIFSPFSKSMNGYSENEQKYEKNLDVANKILDDAGWSKNDEGIREKKGVKISFILTVPDRPDLANTASILVEQWKKLGVEVQLEILSVFDIRENEIRPREYDALLFGQAMSFDPDPYPHWHSDRTKDPGTNFALFSNSKADKVLSDAREELNQEKRTEFYKEFQKILTEEVPAIFIYTPLQTYITSSTVHNMNTENIIISANRFDEIHTWYIKTKRVKK